MIRKIKRELKWLKEEKKLKRKLRKKLKKEEEEDNLVFFLTINASHGVRVRSVFFYSLMASS